MSWGYPQHSTEGGREPKTLITGGTAPDTTSGAPTLPSQGHGTVSNFGAVSVMVDKACTIMIWYYNAVTKTWRAGGIQATDYTIAFAHSTGGIGYFNLPAGARFFLTSDTGTTVLYHDGEPFNA